MLTHNTFRRIFLFKHNLLKTCTIRKSIVFNLCHILRDHDRFFTLICLTVLCSPYSGFCRYISPRSVRFLREFHSYSSVIPQHRFHIADQLHGIYLFSWLIHMKIGVKKPLRFHQTVFRISYNRKIQFLTQKYIICCQVIHIFHRQFIYRTVPIPDHSPFFFKSFGPVIHIVHKFRLNYIFCKSYFLVHIITIRKDVFPTCIQFDISVCIKGFLLINAVRLRLLSFHYIIQLFQCKPWKISQHRVKVFTFQITKHSKGSISSLPHVFSVKIIGKCLLTLLRGKDYDISFMNIIFGKIHNCLGSKTCIHTEINYFI